jgi:hypothetical protein
VRFTIIRIEHPYGEGSNVKIVNNIKFTDEARDWVLRHYIEPHTDDPSQLLFIPTLGYSLETRDGGGKKVAGPRFVFGKQRIDRLDRHVISPFDNGRKFIAMRLYPAEHDANASYVVEYLDGVWYLLKE